MTVKPTYADNTPDYDIELDGFEKFNWKSTRSKEEWENVIADMRRVNWEAEWRSVMDDETDRQAAIIHVNNHNREQWLRRIGDHDLVYRDIRYSESYQGFSHVHKPTDKSDPERVTYSVIAENEDVADKMYEAETEMGGDERHQVVGELLGFPQCCRDFFADVWLGEGQIDPLYEISCNTPSAETIDGDRENVLVKDPNPGINALWRYFGLYFITHLPCSWECERSVDIARNRYRIASEVDDELHHAADMLAEWLKEPAKWTGYHRIANIRNKFATSASGTDNYWDKKRVVWREEPGNVY